MLRQATITDIFDQQKTLKLADRRRTPSKAPGKKTCQRTGIQIPENKDGWSNWRNWTSKPLRTGVSMDLTRPCAGPKLALDMKASWSSPTGAYLRPQTCDGSRLDVGGKTVIDNDGLRTSDAPPSFWKKASLPSS
ncbi:MAG: hypothetical protein ACLT8E_00710 [Akkermansia sp.]